MIQQARLRWHELQRRNTRAAMFACSSPIRLVLADQARPASLPNPDTSSACTFGPTSLRQPFKHHATLVMPEPPPPAWLNPDSRYPHAAESREVTVQAAAGGA